MTQGTILRSSAKHTSLAPTQESQGMSASPLHHWEVASWHKHPHQPTEAKSNLCARRLVGEVPGEFGQHWRLGVGEDNRRPEGRWNRMRAGPRAGRPREEGGRQDQALRPDPNPQP